ncbi:IS6 family transposase [Haloplanus pelagicus]|jgi:transposase-like protein|uniref:IS6 family transposase n=1 Tax=Haloplanus pelagicus TaxID=2949995 RepID=UPI00203DA984|nr:IS6 family transposase [Haloplanus sp. HW8-1]
MKDEAVRFLSAYARNRPPHGGSDRFELGSVEREVTPEPAMKLGIRLRLVVISISNTILILDSLGIERCRPTVHNWVQKADLQPTDGANLDHVAVDETVIQLNTERYWLYAVIDPDINRLLHVRLFSTRKQGLTEMFLSELRDKHLVDDVIFLVDGTPWCQAACHRLGLRFQHVTRGNRYAVERIFRESKRQKHQFSNVFSHVDPSTAENWLQAFAFAWNQLI